MEYTIKEIERINNELKPLDFESIDIDSIMVDGDCFNPEEVEEVLQKMNDEETEDLSRGSVII